MKNVTIWQKNYITLNGFNVTLPRVLYLSFRWLVSTFWKTKTALPFNFRTCGIDIIKINVLLKYKDTTSKHSNGNRTNLEGNNVRKICFQMIEGLTAQRLSVY